MSPLDGHSLTRIVRLSFPRITSERREVIGLEGEVGDI